MATLSFADKHNQVAYLEKAEDEPTFHEIVDFLNNTYIRYSLLLNPTIYVTHIKQFWHTASVKTFENGDKEIKAKVDGYSITITESSLRRHLHLSYEDGISAMPNTKFFENLFRMGYNTASQNLTIQRVVLPHNGDSSYIPSFIV